MEPGTTVVWLQKDPVGHNVHLAANGVLNRLREEIVGPVFDQGGQFAVTFDEEGTYEYACDPHPFMTGRVIVKKAGK